VLSKSTCAIGVIWPRETARHGAFRRPPMRITRAHGVRSTHSRHHGVSVTYPLAIISVSRRTSCPLFKVLSGVTDSSLARTCQWGRCTHRVAPTLQCGGDHRQHNVYIGCHCASMANDIASRISQCTAPVATSRTPGVTHSFCSAHRCKYNDCTGVIKLGSNYCTNKHERAARKQRK
jgi:hypothetical protein